jgi:small-conductance mechanosensitive channel
MPAFSTRLALLLAALLWAPAVLGADDTITIVLRPGQDQSQIDAVSAAVKAATNRPVVIRWDDGQAAAPAAKAAAAKGTTATAAHERAQQAEARLQMLSSGFQTGLAESLSGMGRLAELPRAFSAQWAQSENGTTVAITRLLLLLAVAAAAAFAAHRALLAMVPLHPVVTDDVVGRLRPSARRLAVDLAVAAVFLGAGTLLLPNLLAAPDLPNEIGRRLVHGIAFVLVYLAAGRFVLSPSDPTTRLLPIANTSWHYGMLLAYGILGSIIGQLAQLALWLKLDQSVVEGMVFPLVTAIALLKLWWFVGGRHDIAAAFRGREPNIGPLRRGFAAALPWFYAATAVMIWTMGCIAAGAPQMAHWGTAAGATQILVILVPIAAMGVDALAKALIARRVESAGADVTPLRRAFMAVARSIATGATWVAGLSAISYTWNLFLMDAGSPATLSLLTIAIRVSIAFVVGWVVLSFLKAYFEAQLPQQRHSLKPSDEDIQAQAQGRLATVLPLIRDVTLGAVVAVTALVALSALGFDIGPLLAGFGVIGLALSFGSQALVRDIVSGIFFMADDAFRLGEYIDTGKLKGTVEKITLRSVQLRHQNGQIHTIPFGSLQALTNFSRDWSTIKFSVKLDRETDVEKVRKLVKKVGQDMLADPELGPMFILPLKMQGIQDITETAVVVRLKFTCAPGNPTFLQRKALQRILDAFKGAGIALASNAVTVRGGTADTSYGAAAAQLVTPSAAAS